MSVANARLPRISQLKTTHGYDRRPLRFIREDIEDIERLIDSANNEIESLHVALWESVESSPPIIRRSHFELTAFLVKANRRLKSYRKFETKIQQQTKV